MKLFVGSLPFEAVDQDLRDLFGTFGALRSVKVVTDRETGRSRGFGFVEFTTAESGKQALSLDGTTYGRRTLAVKEAEDRRPVLGNPRPSTGAPRQASGGGGPQVTYKGRPNPPPQEFDSKKRKKRGGSRRRRDDDDYSHWST